MPSEVELSLVHDLRPHLMNGLQHALLDKPQVGAYSCVLGMTTFVVGAHTTVLDTQPPMIVNWHQDCDFVHSQKFQPYWAFVGLAT